jgi:hypothetical protein
MNYIFSIICWTVIRIIQPIALILFSPGENNLYKYIIFAIYFSLFFLYLLYKYFYNPIKFVTTIGKNGHLNWQWLLNSDKYDFFMSILYLVCYIPMFNNFPIITTIIFAFLILTQFIYKLEKGTMWCFLSNSILIYILFKILFIIPFKEYGKLC